MTPLRILIDPPECGFWNMAVDEVLLETAATRGLATLRFYGWNQPTLSLGYFQSAAERLDHSSSLACPLVRRTSGGGAILHDQELTYSLAWPRYGGAASAARALYGALHETLAESLAQFEIPVFLYHPTCDGGGMIKLPKPEPFLCFQRRTCGDVMCGDAKIAGSAQRRRQGAVLQHGSVLLRSSPCAPELAGIMELTGRPVTAQDLAIRWKARVTNRLQASEWAGHLEPAEHFRAERLKAERFESDQFVLRR